MVHFLNYVFLQDFYGQCFLTLETMLISLVHAATRYHGDVHVPCSHVDVCSLSMIEAAKGNHVEFLDPCCHWLVWVRKHLQ